MYGRATGQSINLDKSAISFGSRVEDGVKENIKNMFEIENEGGTGNYLGLPECFSGSKIQMLDFIKERLKEKISSWFARSLSLGGKEILLKAVAMAIPVYAMSCYKLPKSSCKALSSAMAAFWCNSTEDKRKIH